MFPISDDNPSSLTPFITWSLIGVCAFVFLVQFSMSGQEAQTTIYSFGMIPARVFDKVQLRPELMVVPAWATVITSMFMHGGLLHLAGNMLFLWIFGDNVEDAMGHARFLAFYLLCGVAAAMTQALLSPESTVPMVGASGAISGVLGAYLLLQALSD
jgi:membrane associated rhomboid family serine protease